MRKANVQIEGLKLTPNLSICRGTNHNNILINFRALIYSLTVFGLRLHLGKIPGKRSHITTVSISEA